MPKQITVSKNGPYIVSGSVPLAIQTIGVNRKGESTEWVQGKTLETSTQYALCRCGGSKTKPFCDGTHSKIGKFRLGTDHLLVGENGHSSISVGDYAVAMIDELERPGHIRQPFTVGY